VDAGSVRVGLATSDPRGVLATPLETVQRDPRQHADLARIALIVADQGVSEVVVGFPRSLSGAEGSAAQAARAYAVEIARRVMPVPVRLVDERLSTVSAQHRLRDAGVQGRRHRPVIDQAAAVVILQAALDTERVSGRPPGSLVAPGPPPEGPESADEVPEAR
jgi:putative holliday junction resolvase